MANITINDVCCFDTSQNMAEQQLLSNMTTLEAVRGVLSTYEVFTFTVKSKQIYNVLHDVGFYLTEMPQRAWLKSRDQNINILQQYTQTDNYGQCCPRVMTIFVKQLTN
jgi:uncharacterized protein YecT (DUF1311 family)